MSHQMSIQIQRLHSLLVRKYGDHMRTSCQLKFHSISKLFRKDFFNESKFIAVSHQIRRLPTSWDFFLLFFHLPDFKNAWAIEQITELTDIRDQTIHVISLVQGPHNNVPGSGVWHANTQLQIQLRPKFPKYSTANICWNSVTNSWGRLIFNNDQVKSSPALRVWPHKGSNHYPNIAQK